MSVEEKLVKELRKALQANADPKAALTMQAYMKSSMPFYGVKTPVMRAICKEAFEDHPITSFSQWHDTVLHLWRKAKFRELRYCAIQLCETKQYQQFQTIETIPLYEEMIVTGAWWDYVDVIASHRIGYLLKQYPKALKPLMKQWSKDKDLWKRRTSILCQLSFKGETDLALLYACIKPSLGSEEFFLRKAIGWALRSYAWYDVEEVSRYVDENKHKLSQLSQREALKNREKLLA
jgi:3-methyladenine DNA glycosylase AlkD